MNREERIQLKLEVESLLLNDEETNMDTDIQYIVSTSINGKVNITTGLRIGERENALCIYSNDNYLIDEVRKATIEEHCLFLLSGKHEIVYISLPFHLKLWRYIDNELEGLGKYKLGIQKYITFCEDIGITATLLNELFDTNLSDLCFLLNSYLIDDYELLLAQKVGEYEIIIGFNEGITNINYSVTTVYPSKVKETDFHDNLENAFWDFKNRFYSLSIDYYKELEKIFNDTIDGFEDCFLEDY